MRLSALAFGGLLLAASGTLALAQAPTPPPKIPLSAAASPAMGNVPADNPFTVAGIDPTSPFGEIDVDLSTNPDELALWEKTLTKAQTTELDQRCDVITKASDLAPEPLAFCDMWLTVRAGEEGVPGDAPVTIPEVGGGFTQLPAPGEKVKAEL
jgi:hypothetical protein